MKKKYLYIIISVVVVSVLIGINLFSDKYEYVIDHRGFDDDYTESESNVNDDSNNISTDTIQLNPFDGLIVEFDGVSPFCTISFNNSKCSEDVQKYVQYSVEPLELVTTEKHFKINEQVTVYASLKNQDSDNPEFSLSEESKVYTVENVPEYITEITDDMDLSNLIKESQDYLTSITAFSEGTNLGTWKVYDSLGLSQLYKDSKESQKDKYYFSFLKINSYNKFKNETDCFNRIDLTYSIKIMGHYDNDFQNRYFSIVAKNIVKYPDGTIGWGLNDPADKSFEHNVDATSMESLKNSNITSIKADYNVTEITDMMN